MTKDVTSETPLEAAAEEEIDLTAAAQTGAVWLTVVTFVSKGAQILVTLGLAAMLSTHDVGLVTVTTSLLNIVSLLQIMGVYDVISRTRKDPLRFSGSVATMSAGISAVLTVVGLLVADWLAGQLGAPDAGNLLRLAFLSLPFAAYGGVQNALMSRRMQFRLRALSDGGSSIIGSAVTLALAWLGFGAYASAWGVLVTMITAMAIAFVAGIRIMPHFDTHDMRETISWASVVGPAAIVGLVLMNTDYFVVSKILGQAENGIYSLGFRIAYMPLAMIGTVLLVVAFQVFAELYRREDVRALNRSVVEYMAVCSFILFGCYAVLYAVAEHLDLLGTKWGPSVGPMRVLCLYGALYVVGALALDALRAAGEKKLILAAQIVQLAVLPIACILLTKYVGIAGTAWSQVLASAAVAVFAMVMLRRRLDLRPMRIVYALLGPIVGSSIVIGVFEVVSHFLPHRGPNLLAAVASGLFYLALYVGGVSLVDRGITSKAVAAIRRR